MPELLQGVLSDEEVSVLVREMKVSPGFANYSEKELRAYDKRQLICLRQNGQLCGIAAYKLFGRDWAEFTTIIILPEFRSRGLGKQLWQTMLEKLAEKNVLVISANSLVKNKLALADGFVSQSF